jgi:hypothetical protein
MCVTGDHSTPVDYGDHSAEPGKKSHFKKKLWEPLGGAGEKKLLVLVLTVDHYQVICRMLSFENFRQSPFLSRRFGRLRSIWHM